MLQDKEYQGNQDKEQAEQDQDQRGGPPSGVRRAGIVLTLVVLGVLILPTALLESGWWLCIAGIRVPGGSIVATGLRWIARIRIPHRRVGYALLAHGSVVSPLCSISLIGSVVRDGRQYELLLAWLHGLSYRWLRLASKQ